LQKVDIVRIEVSSAKRHKTTDYVAEEKPLRIFLAKAYYATIFCTPSSLKELTIGHLLSSGVFRSVGEVQKVELNEDDMVCLVKPKPEVNVERRLRLSRPISQAILSACGGPTSFFPVRSPRKIKSELTVTAEVVSRCASRLNLDATVFRKTGGVHVAAVYENDGTIEALAEDVGRHNAVDKAIGACASQGIDLGKCFLGLSGRLSGDIVLKAVTVGIPIVVSLAAALDSGVAYAKSSGLTLVGFVRGKRMNVYSFPERIIS
jgi:FdhD protein